MTLSNRQINYLRSKAHSLKPVVMIGQHGVTENVLNEIHGALEHHELIKVKIQGLERDDRQALCAHIINETRATIIQLIGRVAVLYRPAKEPKLILPMS